LNIQYYFIILVIFAQLVLDAFCSTAFLLHYQAFLIYLTGLNLQILCKLSGQLSVKSCFKFILNIISVVIAQPFPIKIKEKRLWQSSVLCL